MKHLSSTVRPALVVFAALTLVTGVAYPIVVWGASQTALSHKANGSFVEVDGKVVGSELIAQPFTGSEWFWPRPSAAGYNGAASSGSNLAPSNPALVEAVQGRVDALRAADAENDEPVPVDLVTTSGSGLDPHISPEAALYQAPRVAKARGLSPEAVERLVGDHVRGRQLGFLGEPTVNVLELNLALRMLEE